MHPPRRDPIPDDSQLVLDLIPEAMGSAVLADLRNEIAWQDMMLRGGRVPRDVAIQGSIKGDLQPLYRHPVDEQPPLTPFTPTVDRIRQLAEGALGQPLNHALLQRYPDRIANISLHADKTLDIARGSSIVNVSIGATRTMLLQHKDRERRDVRRIDLPHRSMFVLGWQTNRNWRHGIRPDRRRPGEHRPDERRDEGQRISLTFRHIATFLDPDGAVTGTGRAHGPQAGARRREARAAHGLRAREPRLRIRVGALVRPGLRPRTRAHPQLTFSQRRRIRAIIVALDRGPCRRGSQPRAEAMP